jgi:hypothetical protein
MTWSTTKVVVWGEGRKRKERKKEEGEGQSAGAAVHRRRRRRRGWWRRPPGAAMGAWGAEAGALESPSGESDARETSRFGP